jgi:hypothetical protein
MVNVCRCGFDYKCSVNNKRGGILFLVGILKLVQYIFLLTVMPAVVPIATAFATVRIRVVLSPQAKTPGTVVS